MSSMHCAFAGELFAGKDHVAAQVCYQKMGFADPIYAVSRFFNGTDDKTKPGIRRFMQLIGQWGWGYVSDTDPDYGFTVERALMTERIRSLGVNGAFGDTYMGWFNFGKSRTLWVDMLAERLARANEPTAITNVRFVHEIDFAKKLGIPLYLVAASEETRRERMVAAGRVFSDRELNDTSEQLARKLMLELPSDRIVWNDHRPCPLAAALSVPQFVERVQAARAAA